MIENMIGRKLIMRKTTILRSRNKLICFVLLIRLMTLGACSSEKKLTESNFKSIKAGMTTSNIKTMIGEPQKIVKNKEEVKNLMDEDSNSSTDRWSSENPNLFNEFYGEKKDYYYDILDQMKDIICYEYDYKYDEKSSYIEKWHIYFYKDEVVWMSFP
ncbi:hypothetical protein [Enterococcus sp. AZ007]|uniref:hypothetical protein n=1 Tax=Enterococcus sp. AZ007 TaxID=2774839 RepID=UPI003F26D919